MAAPLHLWSPLPSADLALSLGLLTAHRPDALTAPVPIQAMLVQGRRAGVDDTRVQLWSGTGAYQGRIAAAQPLYVAAGNAADAPGGTGARSVRLYAVTAAGYFATVDLPTSGDADGDPTSLPYLRVYAAEVLTAGSGGTNAGAITIKEAGSNTVMSHMLASEGMARQGMAYVPTGYEGRIARVRPLVESATDKTASLYVYERTSAGVTLCREHLEHLSGDAPPVDGLAWQRIGERSDVWVEAVRGQSTLAVGVRLALVLVPLASSV